MEKKEKTIYDLKLHETLVVMEELLPLREGGVPAVIEKKYEVTRVAGGWIYAFEFSGFRQSPITFVPYNSEFDPNKTILVGPTLAPIKEE